MLKQRGVLAEVESMLLVQTLLTVAYLVLVGRVWSVSRHGRRPLPPASLAAADLAPESAVGWPPLGEDFEPYVDEGIAALDAYLSEGFAT